MFCSEAGSNRIVDLGRRCHRLPQAREDTSQLGGRGALIAFGQLTEEDQERPLAEGGGTPHWHGAREALMGESSTPLALPGCQRKELTESELPGGQGWLPLSRKRETPALSTRHQHHKTPTSLTPQP